MIKIECDKCGEEAGHVYRYGYGQGGATKHYDVCFPCYLLLNEAKREAIAKFIGSKKPIFDWERLGSRDLR